VPTISFRLRVDSGGASIRAVQLDVQIQIAARRRGYDPERQGGLWELFGTPDRWAETLRTLPWLRTTVVVPPFTGATTVELPVVCTYDLEVVAARYFASVGDGVVPLDFLFSGAVFYADAAGRLQTVRIAWDCDADYALPVAVWREAIDRHFPDSAWLRLRRASFDRLQAYKGRRAFATMEDALDALLNEAGE
jgi:Family of unknown function (DUF6084)